MKGYLMKINFPVITLFFASVMVAVLNVAVADEGNQWHRENIVPYSLIHASAHGDFEEVKRLLEAEVNPDEINEGGWTALMAAANNGHAEVVKVLLDAGANPSAADKKGRTIWKKAKVNGHDEVVKLLLVAGAKPEAKQKSIQDSFSESILDRAKGVKIKPSAKSKNQGYPCDPGINWIRICRLTCDGSVFCSIDNNDIVGHPCYCMKKMYSEGPCTLTGGCP